MANLISSQIFGMHFTIYMNLSKGKIQRQNGLIMTTIFVGFFLSTLVYLRTILVVVLMYRKKK